MRRCPRDRHRVVADNAGPLGSRRPGISPHEDIPRRGIMSVSDMRGAGAKPPGRGFLRFLRRRRTWSVLAAAVVLAIGIAVPAMAVLSGSPSKFEANDGNMVVDTAGNSDWNS